MWNCVYKLRVKIWKISVHIQRRRFPGCNQHHLSRSLGISLLTLQVGKFMEIDEERKDSTSIQGNSLATQIDFWKNEIKFWHENDDPTWLTKHKTGLPNSVTISGNMPGEEAREWLLNNVSLYWRWRSSSQIFCKMSKDYGFDLVNDRMQPKTEKKLVCCVLSFISIIDKFNQPKLLPVSTELVTRYQNELLF